MSKIVLLMVICCLCLLQVQSQEDRIFCQNLNRECLRHERTVGARDDTVTIYNDFCRLESRTWRDITRCQLVRASCELTLVRCALLTCRNVAGVLQRN